MWLYNYASYLKESKFQNIPIFSSHLVIGVPARVKIPSFSAHIHALRECMWMSAYAHTLTHSHIHTKLIMDTSHKML